MAVRSRNPNVPPARFVAISSSGLDVVAVDDDGRAWRLVPMSARGEPVWLPLPLHPDVMEVPDVG